ncbi:MAG: rhomboid family intramembrane serine protease [Treponema sp.]|nr:rhomboid family intramembrane serine protease [Treponema sp.]MCL2251897.1 rhomboid family intramembrane serine protease [Treponema sp.]
MKLKYNSPVVLTFTLLCAIILLLSYTLLPNLAEYLFMVPGKNHFSIKSPRNFLSIITHVFGHADWSHLIGNFTLILLIGPMLEAKYSSKNLFFMMLITAFVTGILNIIFFKSALMGASGIVFMMILLSSFTNFSHGEIPVTFILVLILYMGVQILESFRSDNISQFAHIVGGLCGSVFGFLKPPKE